MDYIVNAFRLNLRSTPVIDPDNIILVLRDHERVRFVEDSGKSFYKVSCVERNPPVEGYASPAYLRQNGTQTTQQVGWLTAVNLHPNAASRRDNHAAWQYPLGEANLPGIAPGADAETRISCLHQIVDWLVVNKSARYKPDTHTYCNIYAYDYCYLAGVFLPRVWWRAKAIIALQSRQLLNPVYDENVDEINANGLFGWLEEWGADFGWTRTYNLDELQNQVNLGNAGVICAANINPNRSGHICCVLPETDSQKATRINGAVSCPLLSQAGRVNLPYYSNNRWWVNLATEFRGFGYWYCTIQS